jgi:hypothetical protein
LQIADVPKCRTIVHQHEPNVKKEHSNHKNQELIDKSHPTTSGQSYVARHAIDPITAFAVDTVEMEIIHADPFRIVVNPDGK